MAMQTTPQMAFQTTPQMAMQTTPQMANGAMKPRVVLQGIIVIIICWNYKPGETDLCNESNLGHHENWAFGIKLLRDPNANPKDKSLIDFGGQLGLVVFRCEVRLG